MLDKDIKDSKKPFRDACDFLMQTSNTIDHFKHREQSKKSSRHARVSHRLEASSSSDDEDDLDNLIERDRLILRLLNARESRYSIPNDLFYAMDEVTRQGFIDARDLLKSKEQGRRSESSTGGNNCQGDQQGKQQPSSSNDNQLPMQYGKRAQASNKHEVDDESDHTEDDDPGNGNVDATLEYMKEKGTYS